MLYPDELQAQNWSGWRDSNSRHPAPKAGALPDCAIPRLFSNPSQGQRLHDTVAVYENQDFFKTFLIFFIRISNKKKTLNHLIFKNASSVLYLTFY